MAELTRIQIVVALQSCDLFAFCRAEEILRIAGIARERQFPAGRRIYEKSDPAEVLYAVIHGAVSLDDGRAKRRAGPLAAFGVTELLSGRLRGETATAEDDTLVLAIEAEDFFDLLSNNIDIVKALFRHLLRVEAE
jgi:CRP-like cAMP-binding protein